MPGDVRSEFSSLTTTRDYRDLSDLLSPDYDCVRAARPKRRWPILRGNEFALVISDITMQE